MRFDGGLGKLEQRNWRDFKFATSSGETRGLATVGGNMICEVLVPMNHRFVLTKVQVFSNGAAPSVVIFFNRSTATGMGGVKTRMLTYYGLAAGRADRNGDIPAERDYAPILAWFNNTGADAWFQAIVPTALTSVCGFGMNAATEYNCVNMEYFLYDDIATATLLNKGGMGVREIRNLARVLLHADSGEIQGNANANGTLMIAVEVPAGNSLTLLRLGVGFQETINGDWLVNVVNSNLATVGGAELPVCNIQQTAAVARMHCSLGDGLTPLTTIDNRAGVASRWLLMYIPQAVAGVATNNAVTDYAAGDFTYILE